MGKSKKINVEYKIGPGDRAPKFKLPATGEKSVQASKDFEGCAYVLYFYPKDNTPGCTLEGQDFKRLRAKFAKLGCEILGVSKDSMKAHEKFSETCGFSFPLLSDEEAELARAYDVMQMKSLYGRRFEGIERSTFLIDQKGVIRGAWRKVKVPGHAEAVYEFAKEQL